MTPAYVVCSPREYQVVNELLKDGAQNKVIARRLDITEDTVKSHLKAVYARCPGQVDRTSLVVALFHGDIEIGTSERLSAVA